MFALRLVRLIEDHADQLSEGLMSKLKASEACHDLLLSVPANELRDRAFEIYRNVTEWLLARTELEVEKRYIGLGERRARQGVPYSQMLYAIHTTKEHLWEFLRQEDLLEAADLIGEMDLLYSLGRFFDRSAYFLSLGYERANARDVAHRLVANQGH